VERASVRHAGDRAAIRRRESCSQKYEQGELCSDASSIFWLREEGEKFRCGPVAAGSWNRTTPSPVTDDDNRILECAVKAGSDVIITHDHDLLRLGEFRGIRIMKAADSLGWAMDRRPITPDPQT
jgi:hypothetical protein